MRDQTRVAMLTRVTDIDGKTLHFTTPSLIRGRCPLTFIAKERVPDFEGGSASFDIVKRRLPNSPWPEWVVLRRVEV